MPEMEIRLETRPDTTSERGQGIEGFGGAKATPVLVRRGIW